MIPLSELNIGSRLIDVEKIVLEELVGGRGVESSKWMLQDDS